MDGLNFTTCTWGNNVDLVLCVLLGHPNSKNENSMKLVTFAFFHLNTIYLNQKISGGTLLHLIQTDGAYQTKLQCPKRTTER